MGNQIIEGNFLTDQRIEALIIEEGYGGFKPFAPGELLTHRSCNAADLTGDDLQPLAMKRAAKRQAYFLVAEPADFHDSRLKTGKVECEAEPGFRSAGMKYKLHLLFSILRQAEINVERRSNEFALGIDIDQRDLRTR